MSYPDFFDAVPRLRLCDPLAVFLGASDDGVIEYGYIDAVKLAGGCRRSRNGGANAVPPGR